MSSLVSPATGTSGGILDRSRTVAGPGFNRWLVPPAALAIHLCIGMAYALSVFWLPIGKSDPQRPAVMQRHRLHRDADDDDLQLAEFAELSSRSSSASFILGLSAALFGGWLERVGPRKAAAVAALCWGGGFLIGAVAVHIHQLWLLCLGLGLIGGIGLGLGYISPVSTLIKWFPDRRGMATGMAIMGFGGGAMIGAPLANLLMAGVPIVPDGGRASRPADPGVMQTYRSRLSSS